MKNLFKMTTAALALVAFASCSNDELLGSKNSPEAKNFTSILEYEIEEPDGLVGTRAARNAEGKGFVFQENDQLRVYDEDLGKFDTYTFATQFGREGDTKLQKDPAYALFPYGDIRKGYCDADGNHIAEIKIGERKNAGTPSQFQVIEYSNEAGSETKVGDEVLYKCNVPMWGTVEKIDDKTVKADKGLKPLTGVLMLTLGKTLGNAAWLRLSTVSGYLGGTFYANLDSDEPKLYVDDKNEYQDLSKDLYIDLRKVPSDKAVLYIPVVAGVNDLRIYRTTNTGDDPTLIGAWTMISNESGYTFKRNGYHKVSYEYTLAASAPEAISLTMEQLKAQTEDLELNMAVALNLTGTVTKAWDKNGAYVKAIGANDNTIYMPKMAAETVTLNIENDVTTAAGKDDLMIVDADPANPFTGTLVVNAASVSKLVDFDIDLPKATVVLEGDFAAIAGQEWKIYSITADVVEIGDGTIPTNIDVTAIGAGTDLSGVKTAININKGATFTGLIDTQAATTYFAPITIKGKVDGNINTNGDVNVELAAPDEAITGTLTFFRGGTTCTLKQGYIDKITNNFTALGEANNHEVTVKLDDAEGITAIKDVTVVPHGTIPTAITLTESTLSGKTIPAAIDGYTNAATGIYTASQFERLHTKDVATPAAVTIKLGNDLNMAKAAWKAPFGNGATAFAFSLTSVTTNVNHTIKNLSYNKYEYTVKGVGLVGKAAALTMSDITLDNVSFTAEYFDNKDTNKEFKVANIGGIAGTTTGAVDLDRVTVNLANDFGYSAYKIVNTASLTGTIEVDPAKLGIGGFIGIAEGTVTLDQVNVKGALIQGYTCLGGFVGQAQDDIDVDQYTPVVASKSEIAAFKSNYSNPLADDMEMNFARIAAGFGYVNPAATPAITIGTSGKKPTATPVAITVPAGKTGKTFVALGSAGSGQTQYMYSAGQPWIGFCGTEAAPAPVLGAISIDGKAYVVPTVVGTAFKLDNAPALNLYNWVKKN